MSTQSLIGIEKPVYTLIGRQRLARVLLASWAIQGISYRDIEEITTALWGIRNGVNKNTLSSYAQAHTRRILPITLSKFACLVFHVSHLETAEDNPIGDPVFKKYGKIPFYEDEENPIGRLDVEPASDYPRDWFKSLRSQTDLITIPDAEIRYGSFHPLETIAKTN